MSALRHSEIVLLALLAEGPDHAYGLVQKVRAREVEQWARVPESTLYATLRRMEEEGWVVSETEPGERAKTRTRYRRTEKGARQLDRLIDRGLTDGEPVYSDLLVASVFAGAHGRGEALDQARLLLRRKLARLERVLEKGDLSPHGRGIVEFYQGLARLHRTALETFRDASATPVPPGPPAPPPGS